jgi:hypothetical protein
METQRIASLRDKGKRIKNFALLSAEGEERGAQRSVGGVSLNAMYLRYCRMSKLTRTLLRSSTLSFASDKEGYKTINYFNAFALST